MTGSTEDQLAVRLARQATEASRRPRLLLESGAEPLDVIDAIGSAQTSLLTLKRRLVLDDCRRSLTDRRTAAANRVGHLTRTLSRGLRG